ncbi:unnamed protein product [Mycena citricolor]|uniref:Sulfotransferase family protein n=1 Tax=Mycena citricolor TaxID=2018698 RepID=A0AAD2HGP4_9AGAR|nr:unnamed protein product [Mycena citricolor]
MSAPLISHAKPGLKVLSFGYSRTGTSSMRQALEELGYKPTNHGFDIFEPEAVVDMWTRAIVAKFWGIGEPLSADEWRAFLEPFQGVTDMPHYLFVDELLAAFPDAMVPVTHRDTEAWWASFSTTVRPMLRPMSLTPAATDPQNSPAGRRIRLGTIIFSAFFGVAPDAATPESFTKERGVAAYEAHYAHLRAVVPKDRFLQFHVAEGWGPLCAFLGKDIPDIPFPRVNDAEQFRAVMPGIVETGNQGTRY